MLRPRIKAGKGLTRPWRSVTVMYTKARGRKKPMALLLREPLRDGVYRGRSIRAIALETGLKDPSLLKSLRGERSLRLDKANALAAYFGIECRRPRKQKGKN